MPASEPKSIGRNTGVSPKTKMMAPLLGNQRGDRSKHSFSSPTSFRWLTSSLYIGVGFPGILELHSSSGLEVDPLQQDGKCRRNQAWLRHCRNNLAQQVCWHGGRRTRYAHVGQGSSVERGLHYSIFQQDDCLTSGSVVFVSFQPWALLAL